VGIIAGRARRIELNDATDKSRLLDGENNPILQVNASGHRLPPEPSPFRYTLNRKQAAIRWNGLLDRVSVRTLNFLELSRWEPSCPKYSQEHICFSIYVPIDVVRELLCQRFLEFTILFRGIWVHP